MNASSLQPVRFKIGEGEGDILSIETLEDIHRNVSVSFVLKRGTTMQEAEVLLEAMKEYIDKSSVRTW